MAQTAPETLAPQRIDFAGYGLALAGAMLFSTKSIFIKLAYQSGVGAETVLALRMIVALPCYAVIGAWLLASEPSIRRGLTPGRIARTSAVGLLGYFVASLLDMIGLKFLTAEYERLVLFTYPFFTLALGVFFFGDRMNWRVVPALATSYAGLMVIFGWHLATNPHGLVAGTLLVLSAGLSFALYQHFARREMAGIGSRAFTCIAMMAAGSAAVLINTVQAGVASYGHLPASVWLWGLCLGLFGTVLPSFFLNGAIGRIGARATSSIGSTGPIMTIALAVAILGEPFTIYHAIGTALVLLGSVMFTRAERTPQPVLARATE